MRAAAYLRVSTDEQAKEGWNLDGDRRLSRELATARGWHLADADMFDDGRLQGDNVERPELRRLLESLGDYQVLIVRDLDRYARHLPTYLDLRERVRQTGVEVWEFMNPRGPVGFDLSDNLKACIAEDEKRKIGVRVRQALAERARAGELATGITKYGYAWRPVEPLRTNAKGKVVKELVVVPDQAAIVKAIWRDYLAGMSQRSIARKLNGEGVRTHGGGTWTQSAVGKVLRSRFYTGKVEFKVELFDGNHESIVSDEDGQRANRKSSPRRNGGREPSRGHLLSRGLFRCICGSALIPRNHRDVYECKGRIEYGPDHCSQGPIKRAEVDEPFLRAVLDDFIDLDATQTRIADRMASALDQARAIQAERLSETSRVEESFARVERDYLAGRLEVDDWRRFKTKLTDELDGARAALEQARANVQQIEHGGPVGDAERVLLERLATLKKAVAAGVGDAPDIAAVRNVIGDLFEMVELVVDGGQRYLRPISHFDVDRLPGGGWDFESVRPRRLELALKTQADSKVTA